MHTTERFNLILNLLEEKQLVTILELVELTSSSESTIRRDLSKLEAQQKLVRVHGGATNKHSAQTELSYSEKTTHFVKQKKQIANLAASIIKDHECIYLDAGTTTYEMIPYLANRHISVVTNGLTHLDRLNQFDIKTFLIGGEVKHTTKAVIGAGALHSLKQYHFDRVFIGANAIDLDYGYSTPDPEEATVKKTALNQTEKQYVVADHSKLKQKNFAQISPINGATLIIDAMDIQLQKQFKKKTNIKLVAK
ncbi:DeoR/GlpR family DNA-binding transcription regulator [Amphibacillus sp. Q70]|uniref:DeoR/GlpR family DNA-binding transcription regulator n=1 Tax=Amphibacillus sp. Q70 TaxID=3453416 RepID=UPI003F869AD7